MEITFEKFPDVDDLFRIVHVQQIIAADVSHPFKETIGLCPASRKRARRVTSRNLVRLWQSRRKWFAFCEAWHYMSFDADLRPKTGHPVWATHVSTHSARVIVKIVARIERNEAGWGSEGWMVGSDEFFYKWIQE